MCDCAGRYGSAPLSCGRMGFCRMNRGVVIAGAVIGFAVVAGAVFVSRTRESGRAPETPGGYALYAHTAPDFRISYPNELRVEEHKEEGSETILFAHPDNDRADEVTDKIGFQMFMAPFEGAGPLTRERILQALPEAVIEEPVEVIVNPGAPPEGQVAGLVFWSAHPVIGRTRELWFVRGGYLYEITTYAHLDGWLGRLMDSMRF